MILALATCLAVLTASTLFFTSGCGGPRGEVAQKKMLDHLDDLLGKIDVQKAEIDGGIKAAKQGVEGIRKAKIKAQIQLEQIEQIDEKLKPFEEKIGRCDHTLARLRDLIKADMPADIAGKSFSVADLNEMANKVIQARKDADSQIAGFKTARQNMQKLVADLTKTQHGFDARIANLQSQVAKLDAEMTAAKALKQASATMGDGTSTLASNLDDLEKKIATLAADVRGELQGEAARWSETKTDKSIDDVDAFIRDAQNSADTLAEIDRILGAAKK
jgi:phage shock protein A